jgi:hypothetical protein
MGMNPERGLSQSTAQNGTMNISVFFLVERDNKYFLMYYRCFPFPIEKRLVDPLKRNDFQF